MNCTYITIIKHHNKPTKISFEHKGKVEIIKENIIKNLNKKIDDNNLNKENDIIYILSEINNNYYNVYMTEETLNNKIIKEIKNIDDTYKIKKEIKLYSQYFKKELNKIKH